MRTDSYNTTLLNKVILEKKVLAFFKQQGELKKPLLLGFSGGSDSLALAFCLLRLEIPFHLAHFDHAWRKESETEALQLKEWANEHHLPFHSRRSPSPQLTELGGREERYQFFQEFFETGDYEAVILAHQKEDQTETILKRFFEGSQLTSLQGIKSVHQVRGVPLWRPLLEVSKREVVEYLDYFQLTPIRDPTNEDPRYLRGKLRTQILPYLSKAFGKEISPSLVRIGEYAKELDDYLSGKGPQSIEGPFGLMWDCTSSHPLEIRTQVSKDLKKRGVTLTFPLFDQILNALISKTPNHKVTVRGQTLIVDRGLLFFLPHPLPSFTFDLPLEEGEVSMSPWKWTFKLKKNVDNPPKGWRQWWEGKTSLFIPHLHYRLASSCQKVRKSQNEGKVPAFLRKTLPVLRGKEVKEFLVAKGPIGVNEEIFVLEVEIKREI